MILQNFRNILTVLNEKIFGQSLLDVKTKSSNWYIFIVNNWNSIYVLSIIKSRLLCFFVASLVFHITPILPGSKKRKLKTGKVK